MMKRKGSKIYLPITVGNMKSAVIEPQIYQTLNNLI
jgi:hypothetical protein